MTNHLRTMGAKEISRALFLNLIKKSSSEKVEFNEPSSAIIDKMLINKAEKTHWLVFANLSIKFKRLVEP